MKRFKKFADENKIASHSGNNEYVHGTFAILPKLVHRRYENPVGACGGRGSQNALLGPSELADF